MEVESSPLAAMQPNFLQHAKWDFNDISQPREVPRPLVGNMFGPQLGAAAKPSIFKSGRDSYFELDTRMVSSPTTSLVADLSQNLSIDQTPQKPTPRRSLFTALAAGGRNMATTPPIPASSPADDSMDMSPLPHKAPFKAFLPSSPIGAADESADVSMSSPTDTQFKRMDPPPRRLTTERKRSGTASRPSLLGRSRFSSASFAFSQPAVPAGLGRTTSAPQVNLAELFNSASPEKPRKMPSPENRRRMQVPRSFSLGVNGTGNSPGDGSPIGHLNRVTRPSRPKTKIRRTLSMFEHPEDVMQREIKEQEEAEQSTKLMSSPSFTSANEDTSEASILPCFKIKDDPLHRINRSVLCEVLDGRYREHYDDVHIVDCRFEYEYEGGHIASAMNINSTETLEDMFFSDPKDTKQLIIFHCEYSAHRAPRMALHLRKRDRELNMHRYPALTYPNIYILDGGYSNFFKEHRSRCEPQQYINMLDESHKATCERKMNKFRKETGYTRAQTFTFGAPVDSSPTASLARRANLSCGQETESSFMDSSPAPRGATQRRMASY